MKWEYNKKLIEVEIYDFTFEGNDLYEYIQEVYDTQSDIEVFLVDSQNKKCLIEKNKSLIDQGLSNESELFIINKNFKQNSPIYKEDLKIDKFNKKLEAITNNQAQLLETIQSQISQSDITKRIDTITSQATTISIQSFEFGKYLKNEDNDEELDFEFKRLFLQKQNLLNELQVLRLEHEECINDKYFNDFILTIQDSYRSDIESRKLEIFENQQKILEKEQNLLIKNWESLISDVDKGNQYLEQKVKIENCQTMKSDTDKVNQQQIDFLYLLDLRKQLRALQQEKEAQQSDLEKLQDEVSRKQTLLKELKEKNQKQEQEMEFQKQIFQIQLQKQLQNQNQKEIEPIQTQTQQELQFSN